MKSTPFHYLSEAIIGAIEENNYKMTMMYLDKNMPMNERYLAMEDFRYAGYIIYAVEMYPEDMEFLLETQRTLRVFG